MPDHFKPAPDDAMTQFRIELSRLCTTYDFAISNALHLFATREIPHQLFVSLQPFGKEIADLNNRLDRLADTIANFNRALSHHLNQHGPIEPRYEAHP
jgi:hypothetical protein